MFSSGYNVLIYLLFEYAVVLLSRPARLCPTFIFLLFCRGAARAHIMIL